MERIPCGMNEEVQVSIFCVAYNHERYIRKTLDGFVNQKTNFRYKVIIHDDASTDRTPQIIREYEEKYPDIFDAIYQTENQYSQGIDFDVKYMNPLYQGKYVAYCEGDDYWCDAYKLQKQYDMLENNPDAAVCWHRVGRISETGNPIEGTYPAAKLDTGCMSSERFIGVVCSDFFQMSSFFCRKEAYFELCDHAPEYALKALSVGIGDLPIALFTGTYLNKVCFLDEVMSCYRESSASSVMRVIWNNREKTRAHYKAMVDMMEAFDQYTEGRYHDDCKDFCELRTFECFARQKDIISIIKNPWCWRRFFSLPVRAQASIAVKGFLLLVKYKVNHK